MRIQRFTAPFFAENCYLVSDSGKAIVIDPGAGSGDRIKAAVSAQNLEVVAVLITHAHVDHVWDAAEFSAPCYVSRPDLYRMKDPATSTSGGSLPLPNLRELYGDWKQPEDLRVYPIGFFESGLKFAEGLVVRGFSVPGHTEGQVLLLLGGVIEAGTIPDEVSVEAEVLEQVPSMIVFTGDHVFAGSVGRSDLPGGDNRQMLHSLRTTANVLDPNSLLLPGHGPATLLSTQLSTNAYIRQARKLG
ncbi:MBL fold metallo-hydrolase [Boudabousia marimammalium]|uniref:Metallo-beta-lactamase domain-containing protein n=1 Tax=Boudabousia marimammalium TaxID=156892 RepID=A0A1Q5PRB9_9ACTO|nr:MBL fold metallo-hydrolase [Boudabousia marimammalium]OKL49975.1 hypothetical protein BM477_03510 [Boudabousia marimammalium]